jgi:hypothetical protein
MEEIVMNVNGSTVSGEFPLAPTGSTVSETQFTPGYEVTVSYSITPAENYAGPPGTAAPPPATM